MSETHLERIQHLSGTPYEIGFMLGRKLGARLEETARHYIASLAPETDLEKLRRGALPWLKRLPDRFQEEYAGLSEGAHVPLQQLVEWTYIEECQKKECSGVVALFDDHAWVARNNDAFVPELWGYVTIREIRGRIPTIHFSMEGDVFTPTGVNKEKLWLHYNFLPVWDKPSNKKPHFPGYVWITETLELCRDLKDVELMLKEIDRDGGMLLFAVDGKTEEFALFDCLCAEHQRRDPKQGWIVGTNHYCTCEDRSLGDDEGSISTLKRYARAEAMLQDIYSASTSPSLPGDLVRILADDVIERRTLPLVTAYSNIACPSTGEMWYTFGGYPSASRGNWQKLDWPW